MELHAEYIPHRGWRLYRPDMPAAAVAYADTLAEARESARQNGFELAENDDTKRDEEEQITFLKNRFLNGDHSLEEIRIICALAGMKDQWEKEAGRHFLFDLGALIALVNKAAVKLGFTDQADYWKVKED